MLLEVDVGVDGEHADEELSGDGDDDELHFVHRLIACGVLTAGLAVLWEGLNEDAEEGGEYEEYHERGGQVGASMDGRTVDVGEQSGARGGLQRLPRHRRAE